MVIDRSDNVVTICEVKYSKGDYLLKKSEYERILNRISTFDDEKKGRKAIQPVAITTYGIKQNEYSDVFHKTLTMDDLF